jgi:hypothetical protein
MTVDAILGAPWTRKHDDPRTPLTPAATRIAYPKSLEDLIKLSRDDNVGESQGRRQPLGALVGGDQH